MNIEPRTFQCKVPLDGRGERLDVFLSRRFKYFSRRQWQQLIKAEKLKVDGRHVQPAYELEMGDTIVYVPMSERPLPVDQNPDVLFEDEHLLVINKPAPCPTVQCGGYLHNTVENWVSQYLHGRAGEKFWMLHRLDLETSGVLLVAKSMLGLGGMQKQFESRSMVKSYLCIVRGNSFPAHYFQELPLGRVERGLIRIKSGVRFRMPYKPALTYMTTVRVAKPYALIRCRLFTGRTNQIRIHLQAFGCWIVGDKLYFEDESVFDRYSKDQLTQEDYRRLQVPRMLLHAHEVRFHHPTTSELMVIQAPMRPDMASFSKSVGL